MVRVGEGVSAHQYFLSPTHIVPQLLSTGEKCSIGSNSKYFKMDLMEDARLRKRSPPMTLLWEGCPALIPDRNDHKGPARPSVSGTFFKPIRNISIIYVAADFEWHRPFPPLILLWFFPITITRKLVEARWRCGQPCKKVIIHYKYNNNNHIIYIILECE